jgi:hypothetical protein
VDNTYNETEAATFGNDENTFKEEAAAPAKGNYPFPVAHRVGLDPKTGKPVYRRTIDPIAPLFKTDTKPVTAQELYDAAKRANLSFPHWQFARNLRHFMRAAGYRLGFAA